MSVYLSPKPQNGLPCAHPSNVFCADLALKPNNNCGKLGYKFTEALLSKITFDWVAFHEARNHKENFMNSF
jgi:hypothetical protein